MRETEDSSDQQCSLSLFLQPSPGMNNPVQFHLFQCQPRLLKTQLQTEQIFKINQHHLREAPVSRTHLLLNRQQDLQDLTEEYQHRNGQMKAKHQDTSERTLTRLLEVHSISSGSLTFKRKGMLYFEFTINALHYRPPDITITLNPGCSETVWSCKLRYIFLLTAKQTRFNGIII